MRANRNLCRFYLILFRPLRNKLYAVPFAVVDAVLETDIVGVPVVEQRELQSE